MASENEALMLKELKKQIRSLLPFIEEYLKNEKGNLVSIGKVDVTIDELEYIYQEFNKILEMEEISQIKKDIIPLKLNIANYFFNEINRSIININRAAFFNELER